MKKSVQLLTVTRNEKLNKDQNLITLRSDTTIDTILPGQFANILIDKSQNTFLRRPFSIHTVDYKCNTVSFLIKSLGCGTLALSKYNEGEILSVIFPLGNSFSLPQKQSKVLLVGGGCGVAPLLLLAQTLSANNNDVSILLGARTANDLVELDTYSSYGKVFATTEDGSFGEKGYVTNHHLFGEKLLQFDRIYSCGPEPMMKAVARKAAENKIFCEVSLENTMACGFGVCLCCVTETVNGNQCVCTEGPVFNIDRLKWQI